MIATDEYDLLTTATGLLNRSERSKLMVRGGEAGDFLEGQVTNAVEDLAPGTGRYGALLTHKGKLRADMRILRTDDGFWLDSEAVARPVLLHLLQTRALGRDVQHEDLTERRALLSLIGPESGARLDAEPPAEEHSHVRGEHGVYVRTDLGVDVVCPAEDAGAVREALEIEGVSEEAAECLRIESGRPRLGRDMGDDTIPEEAGINQRAVSFTKGCYVGQETVARLHYRGKPNRHLRGLRLSEPVERGAEIRLGDKLVGKVSSACVSPALGAIALAIVRREAGPGDTVEVGEGARAEVVELPFRRG